PFYDPATLNMVEATVKRANRDHIHDPNSSNSEVNPTNSKGTGHKIASKDSSKVERVDADLTPDKPIIRLFSEDPIEGSFNEYPKENDTNIVMGGVEINVTNGDANWETEIMINGEKFKDTNTIYEVSGNHKIVAIFRDRFNYTMNYATANINIKKDYLYSPINMDLYSMKDEYENAKYNLLPFCKEFTDEDISKFDLSPGLDGFTRLSSGSIGSILMGTVNGQNNNLITLKLSESPRLEPDTDYIYTMDIATPNQEFTQDQFQPVHYHWYDDASQSAALTNEFLGFEKIDDMFYRVAFKV